MTEWDKFLDLDELEIKTRSVPGNPGTRQSGSGSVGAQSRLDPAWAGSDFEIEDGKNPDKEDNKKYETLTLSGGSIKGILLLGSIYYFESKNMLSIINYVGTSIGSMICYLLILGYTPTSLLSFLCSHQLIDTLDFNLNGLSSEQGCYKWDLIDKHLRNLTLDKIGFIPNFSDLHKLTHKTLTCVTYNKTKKKVEYLNYKTYPEMSCLTAIRMSSNIPIVFSKFYYENDEYIDGGISDNFAVEYAEKEFASEQGGSEQEESNLGINLESSIENNDESKNIGEKIMNNLFSIMQIPLYELNKLRINNCKNTKIICLKSDINSFGFDLDIKRNNKLFDSGFNQTRDIIE